MKAFQGDFLYISRGELADGDKQIIRIPTSETWEILWSLGDGHEAPEWNHSETVHSMERSALVRKAERVNMS